MARSKNYTAHNQSYKAYRNNIKKTKRQHQASTKGLARRALAWYDPRRLRARRHAWRKQ
ncbi:hypothetical protein ZWY2020_034509 [Hordeum vulgare]|nr:hypothetical protein ZWY2020_034509 [Hordeum vulgare]